MTNSNNKPLETIRDRTLKVDIWRNVSEKGIHYNTNGVIRGYQEESGDWKDTRSLSGAENLRGSRLLALADIRILELMAEDKANAKAQS